MSPHEVNFYQTADYKLFLLSLSASVLHVADRDLSQHGRKVSLVN
jgi:hypothetical protein